MSTHSGDAGSSLDDLVFNQIRDAIADGTLAPGQAVRPGKMAERLSVSRTPVVTALKRLNQAGLVDWIPNSGAYVRRFSTLETAQVFELRGVLEGLAARYAARYLSAKEIDELAVLFDEFRRDDVDAGGPRVARAFLVKDRIFHQRIITAAASESLTRTVEQLHVTTMSYSAGLIRTVSVGVAEHDVILDAFKRRDADDAETAMRKHLRRSVDWLYEEAALESEAASLVSGQQTPLP